MGDDKIFERSIISFYLPEYKINSSNDIMVNGYKYIIILNKWLREFDVVNKNMFNRIDDSVNKLLQNYIVGANDNNSYETRNNLKAQRLDLQNYGLYAGAI